MIRKLKALFRKDAAPKSVGSLAKVKSSESGSFKIAIYESELQAIALESGSWDIETGGDLFGIWDESLPTVLLATNTGPDAVRDQTHFRLDVPYLMKLSADLQDRWDLRYFGDWHSHHRLGLTTPSGGDRSRIQRISTKNNFREMAEFIVTFQSQSDKTINVHPYIYAHLPSDRLSVANLVIRKGISPIRQALIAMAVYPEQKLAAYSSFAMNNIVVPLAADKRPVEQSDNVQKTVSAKVMSRALSQLAELTNEKLEIHQTGFGHIMVIPINPQEGIAFAVGGDWPHNIIEIHRIDRTCAKTEELSIPTASATLSDVDLIKNLFQEAKKTLKATHS